ncbi:MAG: ATP-binding cassette domain-containing protein [Oscillospiraceae bacterium]
MIEIKNVSKTFTSKDGKVAAVKNVSLSIPDGEIFGIIGFSGAGKSTLVRCINLLEIPTEGEVWVNHVNMTALSQKELRSERKKIGMIFQHFNLMPSRTVFDNVAYPLMDSKLTKAEKAEKVRSLLALCELSEKENAYPSQLSGGQKQRVAIARALANDPVVLLCDEATSALDPQTTLSILKLLREVNEKLKITMVVITHEMAVVKEICDQVAIMDGGNLVEQGTVFNIFTDAKETITKGFINTTSALNKIYGLIDEKSPLVNIGSDEFIMKLTFTEDNIGDAVISKVSRNYDIDLSIVFSDIEVIKNANIGGVVAIIKGDRKNIENAVRYMIEKNVKVEVLLDGRAIN